MCVDLDGVLAITFSPGGQPVHGLGHPPTGSWTRITQHCDHATITHSGPRDLWTERLGLTAP
ncbi:hypothetical protein AB0G74_08475 [Streptomyces sp. NPDC020875]|uniref:hypothetical protein n=1 Tax=Streptomyces sp. NPDC020875 TaxID=3154898 RepID=UPI0033F3B74D